MSLAKLPTRDPISTYCFVRTMMDLDPDHPVTRSMSLAYWQRDSELGQEALQNADVAIVWGGADSIRDYTRTKSVWIPTPDDPIDEQFVMR